MLKVGGKLSFSTCSLNPIENESVVAALLKANKGKIRLLDVGLPGFKFTPGLTKWKFLNIKSKAECEKIDELKKEGKGDGESYFTEYTKFEDVPLEAVKSGTKTNVIRKTMFVEHYEDEILAELPKCLRVMPHIQNTSGFFITIIEKLAPIDGEDDIEDPEPFVDDLPLKIQEKNKDRAFEFVRADTNDADIQYI